ncbi:MAG: MFS transporter [Sandaracinaceae bacterium]|nr:MFS transporter [Sandaracinaceae bacterium]
MSAEKKSASPLRAILDVRRGEWELALTMFGYFFLVITTFWILKPIKKAVFIRYYAETGLDLFGWHLIAPQAELIAKVANMAVAAVAVVVFSALSRKLHRERLTYVFGAFFLVTLSLYAMVIHHPSDLLAWSYYLYGDLYTTLMVATFFAFLNDSVTPKAAKRLYGLIVLGGVAGGAFGASVLNAWIGEVSRESWMWICVAMNAVIVLLAANAGRLVRKGTPATRPSAEIAAPEPETASSQNPALEGARLVFRSPYLLSIVGLVGLYEIVSTVLDFQFTATIHHYLTGDAIDQQLATVYNITNVASLCVQLFLTTALMNRFRLVVPLLATPSVIAVASLGFLIAPFLWVGSLLNTADGAFSYSVNQSAREALYTPTSRDEKYKAKAFIDMFVQRFAKSLAVGVTLTITTIFTDFGSVRWLSLFVLGVIAVWALAARYGGKRFRELTHEDEADDAPPPPVTRSATSKPLPS